MVNVSTFNRSLFRFAKIRQETNGANQALGPFSWFFHFFRHLPNCDVSKALSVSDAPMKSNTITFRMIPLDKHIKIVSNTILLRHRSDTALAIDGAFQVQLAVRTILGGHAALHESDDTGIC